MSGGAPLQAGYITRVEI